MNVLIVDDSRVIAERLEDLLAQTSDALRVIWHAQSAVEGCQAIRCGNPDVIILDVQMPGGSGMKVLEEARRLSPAPVVIVITNYPYRQYRDRYLEAGAGFFFDKSAQFDQIPVVLLELLREKTNEQ